VSKLCEEVLGGLLGVETEFNFLFEALATSDQVMAATMGARDADAAMMRRESVAIGQLEEEMWRFEKQQQECVETATIHAHFVGLEHEATGNETNLHHANTRVECGLKTAISDLSTSVHAVDDLLTNLSAQTNRILDAHARLCIRIPEMSRDIKETEEARLVEEVGIQSLSACAQALEMSLLQIHALLDTQVCMYTRAHTHTHTHTHTNICASTQRDNMYIYTCISHSPAQYLSCSVIYIFIYIYLRI